MTDRYFHTSMTRISPLAETPFAVEALPRDEWANGDYVAVEVLSTSSGNRVELVNGRMTEVAEADLVLGALGRRHATLEATGTWEEVGPDGRMELLTGAGLLGKCTSLSMVHAPLTAVEYRGHVQVHGHRTNMQDYVEPAPDLAWETPTILVIGTSMSAGKTTAARILIRQLAQMGLDVVGAKITGAGRYRDVLTMGDAGAAAIYDFMDMGLPSTVCPPEDYRDALQGLLARMQAEEADMAVVESGASPLEPYNGAVAVEMIRHAVECTVLASSDPYAVVGVMEAFGTRPDLVTGIASNTRAGIELTEELTGVPTLNIRDRASHPALRELLERTLGLA